MSDVFEEVEEGLRSDKTGVLWTKYRSFVYVIGLLIVAAVGTKEYLQWQTGKKYDDRIVVFESAREALVSGDYAAAEEGFKALVEEDSKLSPMAANYLARVRLEGGGDLVGADAALSAQANGDGEPFERLSTLKIAYAQADSLGLAELEALLADLVDGEDSYAVLAQELIAAKAYEAGDFERARKEFSYLRFAPNAPQGVLRRAQIALAVIPVSPPSEAEADIVDTAEIAPEDETSLEEESGQ